MVHEIERAGNRDDVAGQRRPPRALDRQATHKESGNTDTVRVARGTSGSAIQIASGLQFRKRMGK